MSERKGVELTFTNETAHKFWKNFNLKIDKFDRNVYNRLSMNRRYYVY